MLEYDDSAFLYFAISLLTMLVLPYTYYFLKPIIFGEVDFEHGGINCACLYCKNLLEKKKRLSRAKVWNKHMAFKFVVGVFIWYLWTITFNKVTSIEGLQSFDPFQILDIPNDATLKEIRKKYR